MKHFTLIQLFLANLLITNAFKINLNKVSTFVGLHIKNNVNFKNAIKGCLIPTFLITSCMTSSPVLAVDNDLMSQVKKLQEVQNALDAADLPFIQLPSKVSYREFREGKGNRVVQPGSLISVEMTIRCESFVTGNEPGGVRYYSTKIDTPNNELVWTIGDGSLPPGLEEAMMGMKRNAIRRIEIPSIQVFQARSKNQLPQPSSSDTDGKRRYRNLFKTDATLLFEVLVKSIRDPITTTTTTTTTSSSSSSSDGVVEAAAVVGKGTGQL